MSRQSPDTPLFRPATPNDCAAIIALAVASELFPAGETELLNALLTSHFAGDDKGQICLLDMAGRPAGVAYYAPAIVADRTWDLTMLAVHPEYQRQALGAALVHHVEAALRASGQRLLLVETSGLPGYDRARRFYQKCGFEQEARIRDFYATGDDKVVFRKVL